MTALAETPARRLNTFELIFADGRGEIEWVSQSTFRFARAWGKAPRPTKPITVKALPVSVEESGGALRFLARYLTVEVTPDGRSVRIADAKGARLTEWRVGNTSLEAETSAGEKFYGLGQPGTGTLDLARQAVTTRVPFLLSSAGYAEYYPQSGLYRFDLTGSRRRIVPPRHEIEVFFYFGPLAKPIFEEHLSVTEQPPPFGADDFAVRPPKPDAPRPADFPLLRAGVRTALAGSMSARLIPEFDLGPFANAPAALRLRAVQLATVFPVVTAPASSREFERLRNRLRPYLLSYTKEARDRGWPVFRPLAIDYHEDPLAADLTDEFMVGDEILAAPGLDAGDTRDVYLPRGVWTDLSTGEQFKGRQRIRVRLKPEGPPLFARNSTIVPLAQEDGAGPLELHYFPGQGAEFFLFEEEFDDISQFHAGPALDAWRFEIESRTAREYEWVIHRAASCRSVTGKVRSWRVDAENGTVRIRVPAEAGGDDIVNVAFSDGGH